MVTEAQRLIEWIEGEMTDNLPPLPPCAPEFKPRWPNDPGGYTADQMQAYALAAIAAQHVPQYDQQALELCEACGWKTLIPDEGCLNCERKPQPQPVQQDHYKELAALGWQAIECPVCGSSAQGYPRQAAQLLSDEQKQEIHHETGAGHTLISLVESYITKGTT